MRIEYVASYLALPWSKLLMWAIIMVSGIHLMVVNIRQAAYGSMTILANLTYTYKGGLTDTVVSIPSHLLERMGQTKLRAVCLQQSK